MPIESLLLCTDLDRTLLPNGHADESPDARNQFRQIALRPEVTLAYVTGRHKELVLEAIAEFDIPVPDFVIADVGTSLYQINAGSWENQTHWQEEIAPNWCGLKHHDLHSLFADLEALTLQETEKQNDFKLSYYVPEACDIEILTMKMQSRLEQQHLQASLIWSIDEMEHVGLLDVLPQNATKRHALEFLMQQQGFDQGNTFYAGDSGNDLPVISSDIPSVLVANAHANVKQQALQLVARNATENSLYIAQGTDNMNGNYSAGIIEGLMHFKPAARTWLDE